MILIDQTVTAAGRPKIVYETDAFKKVFGKGAVGNMEVNANV